MDRTIITNLSYTTLLALDTNSSGSGFRLKYKENIYLITAKHVIYDDGDNLRFTEITLTSKKPKGSEIETRRVTLNAQNLVIYRSKEFDIAVILLESNKMYTHDEGYDIIDLSSDQIQSYNNIQASDDIYMIGFPSSLILPRANFFESDRPLISKGIISGFNESNSTFIIDCSAYFGNSGGPVIVRTEDQELKLAGIVSRYIPYVTTWYNNREASISHLEYANSGYTICISIDKILDLIDNS